jgi:hypothetical protein
MAAFPCSPLMQCRHDGCLMTGSETIVVRRATLADRPAIAHFYQRHFSDRPLLTDMRVWDWKFAQQPHCEQLPFFVLERGAEIVGGIGYVATQVVLDEQTVAAAIPVNYFVDPECKGLHALRLLRAVQAEKPITIGANLSADAVRILDKSGYTKLGAFVRGHYLPLTCVSGGVLRALLGRSRRQWRRLIRIATRSLSSCRLLSPEQLSDELLTAVSHGSNQLFWRKDPAYLRWRYANSPCLSPVFVGQYINDKPVGLGVMHLPRDGREAVILDMLWCEWNEEHIAQLIDGMLDQARNLGCGVVVTQTLSQKLTRVLKDCWFGSGPSRLGAAVLVRDALLKQRLADHNTWHFIVGDSDLY